MTLPRIAVTVGDPAGIGPEISRRAADDPRVLEVCEPVLYGPASADDRVRFPPGVGSAEGGRAAYDAVCAATRDAQAGVVDGVTTAPISKAMWQQAGIRWPGHTELLAHLTGARRVAMMFHTDRFNVVLATVHIALAEVPRALTQDRVEQTIRLAHDELPRFGVRRPRIGVAGLNPHAGESGLFGREESLVLEPAIESCRARGVDVTGPHPGDTVFLRADRGEFDIVVACYHDQGLIPIKLLGFGGAVNVTLGLPIVRTSVDHGTAFDIAGRDTADASSLVAAVRLAARLSRARTTGAPAPPPVRSPVS